MEIKPFELSLSVIFAFAISSIIYYLNSNLLFSSCILAILAFHFCQIFGFDFGQSKANINIKIVLWTSSILWTILIVVFYLMQMQPELMLLIFLLYIALTLLVELSIYKMLQKA